MSRVAIRLRVNGAAVELEIEPWRRLLDVLREDLGLTGTKEGCGEGECGACTVLVEGKPVCSCLYPALEADGAEVRTVEGLAGAEGLSALQEEFVRAGAVQCGFCTPGMLMSATALLAAEPAPDAAGIRRALAGNLCRCTGYVQIVEAIQAAARRGRPHSEEEGR